MDALSGRIAPVTGASRGGAMGAAICRELARCGADVFFSHWTPFDDANALDLCARLKAKPSRRANIPEFPNVSGPKVIRQGRS